MANNNNPPIYTMYIHSGSPSVELRKKGRKFVWRMHVCLGLQSDSAFVIFSFFGGGGVSFGQPKSLVMDGYALA